MKRTVMLAVLLVLALGGSAVAAGKITGKQVRNGTVTGVDVRDGSITSTDVADGTIVAADFGPLPPGPTGEDGPTGEPGPVGPKGPDGVMDVRYVMVERPLDGKATLAIATARCPGDHDVLGGGVSTLDPTKVRIVQSAVHPDVNGWFGHLYLDAETQTTAYVWAVCGRLL